MTCLLKVFFYYIILEAACVLGKYGLHCNKTCECESNTWCDRFSGNCSQSLYQDAFDVTGLNASANNKLHGKTLHCTYEDKELVFNNGTCRGIGYFFIL